MDAKEVESFKAVMKYIQNTTHIESFKDVVFLSFLFMYGIGNTEVFSKAEQASKQFSEYLKSVGIRVASVFPPDFKPYGFMFTDDAKELGATIATE